MNILSFRTVALGALVLVFVACSSTAVPTGQSVSSTSKIRPATACPSGGITFTTGGNGTYSVGIGDTCKLYSPVEDTACVPGSGVGYDYDFVITSGASHGTLSDTISRLATFKRTSSGDVSIALQQHYLNPGDSCKDIEYSTYGTITLN
jgi:hypothetical protein